jgi:hypothetical protein
MSITSDTYEALAILRDRFHAGQITLLEFKQKVLETFQSFGSAWGNPTAKAQEYLMGGPISAAGRWPSAGVLTADQKDIDTQAFPDWKLPFRAMEMGDEGIISGVPQAMSLLPPEATYEPPAAGGYADPRTAQEIAREEASLTYGGRQNIFGGFMGGQPGFGQYNPLVQRGINRAFAPLSAQFGLQAATDPYWFGEGNRVGIPSEPQTLDFRSFLKGTPQRWGQQEWINQLAPLGQAFTAGTEGTPAQLDLQAAYGDEATQDRLMSAVLGQRVSPYLRRFVPGSIGQIRQRMFETDPSVDPFQQFLPSPGTWGA